MIHALNCSFVGAVTALRRGSPVAVSLAVVLLALAVAGDGRAWGADANDDGRIDVLDIQATVNLLLTPAPRYPGQGDANGDGVLDVVDVQALVNIILGMPVGLHLAGPVVLPPVEPLQPMSVWLPAVGDHPPFAWSYLNSLPGWMTLRSDGLLQGTPSSLGQHTIIVRVVDASGASFSKSLTLNVSWLNNPPVAVADSYTANMQQTITVAAPGVLANDTDAENDPLVAVLHTSPVNGTLTFNPDGSFVYTAFMAVSTIDSFRYQVNDGRNSSAPATVSITIDYPLAPIAIDDDYIVEEGMTLTVGQSGPPYGLMWNDTPSPGHPMTAALHSQALFGNVAVQSSGGFTYSPMPGYFGEDEFVYQVASAGMYAYATVRIRVHPPGAVGDTFLSCRTALGHVQIGEDVTVIARVRDPGNILPSQGHVVTNIAAQVAGGPWIPLSYDGFTSTNVAVFKGLLPTTGWAFGTREITVRAGVGTQMHFEQCVVAAYVGAANRVGPGRPFATIASALVATPAEGGVLVDAGVFVGAGQSGLSLPKVVLASQMGVHFTRATPQFTPFVSGVSGAGAILAGFTIEPMGFTGVTFSAGASMLYCRIRGSVVTGVGVGTSAGLKIASGDSKLISCTFRDNQLGDGNEASVGGAAAVISGSNVRIDRCGFWNNVTRSTSVSYGGAIYASAASQSFGAGTVMSKSFFAANEALSISTSHGGAIYGQAANFDITDTRFVLCKARSGTTIGITVEAPPVSNNPSCYGGAISLSASKLRVSDARFRGCLTHAYNGPDHGGTIYADATVLTLTRCDIVDSSTQSDPGGGGIMVRGGSSAWLKTVNILQSIAMQTANGGGMLVWQSAVSMFDVKIDGCTTHVGGGMAIDDRAAVMMDQCTISNCGANVSLGRSGGGIHLVTHSALLAESTRITGNTVGTMGTHWVNGGAGVAMTGSSSFGSSNLGVKPVVFRNCLFQGNYWGGTHNGTAISSVTNQATDVTPLSLINCTFAGNLAGNGSAIGTKFVNLTVTNCIFWDNASPAIGSVTGGVALNNIVDAAAPAWITGPGTLPIFANPLFTTGPLGSHYLSVGSPAIDAGTNNIPFGLLTGLTTSPTGQPGVGAPDLGYHYRDPQLPITPRITMTLAAYATSVGVPISVPAEPPVLLAP